MPGAENPCLCGGVGNYVLLSLACWGRPQNLVGTGFLQPPFVKSQHVVGYHPTGSMRYACQSGRGGGFFGGIGQGLEYIGPYRPFLAFSFPPSMPSIFSRSARPSRLYLQCGNLIWGVCALCCASLRTRNVGSLYLTDNNQRATDFDITFPCLSSFLFLPHFLPI